MLVVAVFMNDIKARRKVKIYTAAPTCAAPRITLDTSWMTRPTSS